MSGKPCVRQAPRVLPTSLLLSCLLLLAGCGSLLESDAPPPNEWWLSPSELSTAMDEADKLPLLLSLSVIPGLDSDRILTLDDEARLTPYAGAYWPDRLSRVLTSQISRSLADARGAPAPAHGTAAAGALLSTKGYARGSCELNLEVHEFFGRIDAQRRTRQVNVAINGTYRCGNRIRTVQSQNSESVNSNGMGDIVAAFQGALDATLDDLLKQL